MPASRFVQRVVWGVVVGLPAALLWLGCASRDTDSLDRGSDASASLSDAASADSGAASSESSTDAGARFCELQTPGSNFFCADFDEPDGSSLPIDCPSTRQCYVEKTPNGTVAVDKATAVSAPASLIVRAVRAYPTDASLPDTGLYDIVRSGGGIGTEHEMMLHAGDLRFSVRVDEVPADQDRDPLGFIFGSATFGYFSTGVALAAGDASAGLSLSVVVESYWQGPAPPMTDPPLPQTDDFRVVLPIADHPPVGAWIDFVIQTRVTPNPGGDVAADVLVTMAVPSGSPPKVVASLHHASTRVDFRAMSAVGFDTHSAPLAAHFDNVVLSPAP